MQQLLGIRRARITKIPSHYGESLHNLRELSEKYDTINPMFIDQIEFRITDYLRMDFRNEFGS